MSRGRGCGWGLGGVSGLDRIDLISKGLGLELVKSRGFTLWKIDWLEKLGSGYSKIFQLKIWTSKLYFRDLELKID